MSKDLMRGLREVFETANPNEASRGRSGERMVRGREPEYLEGAANYLPVLACIAGIALLIAALAKPPTWQRVSVPQASGGGENQGQNWGWEDEAANSDAS